MHPKYNYENYNLNEEAFKRNFGPLAKVDTVIPGHFILQNLHGQIFTTAELLGDKVIIETGSVTCPHYCQNVKAMLALARQYPKFKFYVIYVREEHPGENYLFHQTLEQKLKGAEKIAEVDSRTILVDDVEGSFHKYLGCYPNCVYVIDSNGKIEFARHWNQTDELKIHLHGLKVTDTHDSACLTEPTPLKAKILIKTLLRSGSKATMEYLRALPRILKIKKDEKNINRRAEHL